MTENLDVIDWAILLQLQSNGRLSHTELSRRINLSTSATTERVKRMESSGVIIGYRVDIDLNMVGFLVLATVRLKYASSDHGPFHQFLTQRVEILECLRITGDDCYTLQVSATSMPHLEEIVDDLARFGDTTTNVVYSQTLPHRGPQGPGVRT